MNEANETPFEFEGVLRKTMSENPVIAELSEVVIKRTQSRDLEFLNTEIPLENAIRIYLQNTQEIRAIRSKLLEELNQVTRNIF